MKRISHYTAPTPADLQRLKQELDLTSAQLAELANLAQDGHWRKYTAPAGGRSLSAERHFMMAALLILDDAQLARVVEVMREHGAEVELGTVFRTE